MSVVLVLNREPHVAAMTRWAVLFARGLGVGLKVIIAKGEAKEFASVVPEKEDTSSHWSEVEAALLDMGLTANRATADDATSSDIPVKTREVAHETRLRGVLHYVQEQKPSLLIVGKQDSARSEQAEAGRLARSLFDEAPCRTLLLRLGNHEGKQCQSILVPTRDGEHGRAAVRLAYAVTRSGGGQMTAAIVEPVVGEDARALGASVLERAFKNAKVDRDDEHITKKVILANNIEEALGNEAESGHYDLLLLGATNSSGLRKRLFGTLPDKLLNRPGGMAVAVIRDVMPTTRALRNRFERWWNGLLPPLEREQRLEIFERLQVGSVLSMDFLVLISLSTLIAAFGLIQSSAAVVIGAMLVAPLMTPLLGAGMSLVQGNVPMLRTCAISIVTGFLLALVIGGLTGLATGRMAGVMTPELLARCQPKMLDLDVAFFSGIAASYCLARPGLSSALAGVAIAAALVPPIATAGIALTYRRLDRVDESLWMALSDSGSASLLFATNVVAIILGSALTFFLVGIRGSKSEKSSVWVRRVVLALLLSFMALSYFLTFGQS